MLKANNYVIFKYLDVWQEGRIMEIVSKSEMSEEKRLYKVLSFRTFNEVPSVITDNIFPSTLDTAKKFKMGPLYEGHGTGHMPLQLKEVMCDELERVERGNHGNLASKITVTEIVAGFSKFLAANKPSTSKEEMDEMARGFVHCFNGLLAGHLLSDKERRSFNRVNERTKAAPADVCGAEYLLRMILFLEKKVVPLMRDGETVAIVFDYLTYMLDYLNLNRESLFGRGMRS
jgi:hypothetical protein